jgi:hypothetical protein
MAQYLGLKLKDIVTIILVTVAEIDTAYELISNGSNAKYESV